VKQRQRYRRSPHTHAHALIHTPADAHRAIKLAHYRLPDSHHELLEKSIEYKKSPWCARRAKPSPLPPLSFLSFCLSSSFSLFLFLSLLLSLYLSISVLPPFRPLPSLLLAASLARTRGIRVRRCLRRREGELACIHWRSTEIGGMRARTTAKDGDKKSRKEGLERGKRG